MWSGSIKSITLHNLSGFHFFKLCGNEYKIKVVWSSRRTPVLYICRAAECDCIKIGYVCRAWFIKEAETGESPRHGDLRPVPHSQSDRTYWSLHMVRARHQRRFGTLRSGRQHGDNVCWAHILRHTTRHGSRDPPAWLAVLCLDSAFSLEFPSAVCPSAFYSNWFIPTDWSARGWGRGILCSIPTAVTHLSSEHPASTSGASRVYIPATSPDWSGICPRTVLIPFVARHQPTRQLIRSDQNLSISAWPHSIQALHDSAQLFPLHSQDGSDEFYHSLRFNKQPPSPSKFLFPFSAPG